MSRFNVVVIGGGPAGISAAIAASVDGASVLLVERDARFGGVLNQCVHDGFGFIRHGDWLTGPEYAFADISIFQQTNAHLLLQTVVTRIACVTNGFQLTLTNRHGLLIVETNSIVLATGCTEFTAKQISMHGTRPAGVMTAGSAQYYINILGQLPGRSCIIFGSSDVGMAVAKQLTLEGAKVLGVYEEKQMPCGSLRNASHCLSDFDIPLHFGHRITRVFGAQRVRAVELCRVDKSLSPISGTETTVKCDSLILAAGLTPETALADSLGVPISEDTHGPICDQNSMTLVDGIFSCGNALHINSAVDYISESGEIAGRSAARYMPRERKIIDISESKDFLYCVPQCLDIDFLHGETALFFRTMEERKDVTVKALVNGNVIFTKEYLTLRSADTERIVVNFSNAITPESKIDLILV